MVESFQVVYDLQHGRGLPEEVIVEASLLWMMELHRSCSETDVHISRGHQIVYDYLQLVPPLVTEPKDSHGLTRRTLQGLLKCKHWGYSCYNEVYCSQDFHPDAVHIQESAIAGGTIH